ncbi:MAG: hypothetical protein KF850_32255 [Labilithrix sp.]|nr:hypothetical protein [Labilithrix sp.]
MRSSNAAVVAGALAALAACAEAGGEIRGGELTDAGAAATTLLLPDAGGEAPCVGDGSKWSDLYRDIFGPTARGGSCAFDGSCHGTPDGAGAKSPSGIACFDEKGCRQSFLDQSLVTVDDATAPEGSILLARTLRIRRDGGASGSMPLAPSGYVYSAECVDRVKAWIAGGVKDD